MAFHTVQVELRGGGSVTRGLIVHPGAVVILAVTGQGEVVFIRNRRWTVGEALLELPAGTLTRGEEPMAAAGRELQEETGYRARHLAPLCDFFAAPGSSTERMFVFEARELEMVGQRLEGDEHIDVELIAARDLPRLLASGELRDAKSLAAVGVWLARRRP